MGCLAGGTRTSQKMVAYQESRGNARERFLAVDRYIDASRTRSHEQGSRGLAVVPSITAAAWHTFIAHEGCLQEIAAEVGLK